ncbi:MAG: hypothetical protein U5P10_13495 [Spirochaetia bacterium]|nr:hypothetical protein [Spirochaetia bacterium]
MYAPHLRPIALREMLLFGRHMFIPGKEDENPYAQIEMLLQTQSWILLIWNRWKRHVISSLKASENPHHI